MDEVEDNVGDGGWIPMGIKPVHNGTAISLISNSLSFLLLSRDSIVLSFHCVVIPLCCDSIVL